MKGALNLLFLLTTVIAVGIVAYFGTGLIGIANFAGNLQIGGCSVIIPQFGRIECEPLSHTPITAVSTFQGDVRSQAFYVQCGDNEYTNVCSSFSYQCLDDGNILTPPPTMLWYQFPSSAKTCEIGSANWCSANAANGMVYELVRNVAVGSKVRVGGCSDGLGWTWSKGYVYETYIPYGLNVYDSGGKFRYNVQGCSLGDTYADRLSVVRECAVAGCEQTYRTDNMAPDDWVNYVSGYTFVVEGASSKIIDNQYYCNVNQKYALGKITTVGNACYYAPTGTPSPVDCCPGMLSANAYCGSDYAWHPLSDPDPDNPPECLTSFNCIGQGGWIPDYSTAENDIYRWACVSGVCAMQERKNTQCTPPNIGCASGYVCSPDKGYTCVLPDGPAPIVCGDGICRTPFEDELNCPADCSQPTIFDNILKFFMVWIVGTVIALIVLFAASFLLPIPFLKGFAVKNWKLLIAAALALGLLIALIFAVPVANLAASVFGGVA